MPAEFTTDRPAIASSHVTHDMNAAEHPVASRLPKPRTRPAIVGDPDDFLELFRREGGPMKLDDYLNTDAPQLGLHIVSFKDKTLVALDWPHTLMDAMGKQATLKAWTLILQGRADEVAPPVDADADPLADLGKNTTETHKLEAQRMSLMELAQYGLGNALDFWRTQENRVVCVPASFLAKLRKTTQADLDASDAADKPTFLSDGDVLCAWWARLAVSHLPRDSSRTVVLNNAYSLRAPLADDLLPTAAGPYVSNAIGFIPVLLPARDVLASPLGDTAAAIRRAVAALGTRAQVEAFAAEWRVSRGRLPPFFGDSGMHMVTYSNWAKARLFETDFSAAIVAPGGGVGGSTTPRGRPSYIQNNQFGLVLPNGFPIIGKDAEGNYWLSGYMNKGHWGKIEEQLARA